jgi:S1-C subfamily serine protease
MFKKSSNLTLLALVMVVFLLSSLSWAKKSTKEDTQGYLGVYLQELTSDLKKSLDLDESVEGVLVSGVVEDSPAEEAGLEDGDVLISFDGKKVYSVSKLTSLVRKTSPGTGVALVIIRDGKEKKLKVKIGEKSSSIWYGEIPEGITQLKKVKKEHAGWTFYSKPKLGIMIQDLNDQLGEYFGVRDGKGVLITEVIEKSSADEAGLKAGDVIVGIDDQPVENTDDLLKVTSDKEKGDRVELKVLRDKRAQKIELSIKEDDSFTKFYSDIEKMKVLPKIEKLEIPEIKLREESYFDEKELKSELKQLKKEMAELKEELQKLREEIR